MNSPIASPSPPDLRALLDGHRQEIFTALNCHLFGVVTAYQSEPEFVPRVSVQIIGKKQLPDGTLADYPLLTDVPLFVLSGGGAYIQMPINPGDGCLVLFNDVDIDNWWTTGGQGSLPNTPRSHSLSDGMALVGFPNLANPVNSETSAISINYGTSTITVAKNGAVTLFCAGGSYLQLWPDGHIQLVSSIGSSVSIDSSGVLHLAGGANPLSVANAATSLKSALDQLLTALEAWVNTGGTTPNSATIAALEACRTTMHSLLT